MLFVIDDSYNFNIPLLLLGLGNVLFFLNKDTRFPTYFLLFVLSLILGTCISIYNLDFELSNRMVTNRMRKGLVIYFFSISSYFFFSALTKEELWRILDIALKIFLLFFLFEFFFSERRFAITRVSSSFSEPSAAGIFYCFAAPLVVFSLRRKESIVGKGLDLVFLIIGFLVFSKSQVITLAILFFLYIKPIYKVITLVVAVLGVKFAFERFFGDYSSQLGQLLTFFSRFSEMGFAALSNKFQVWDTFITRINGMRLGIEKFIENPFGNGFGYFSVHFAENYAPTSGVSQGEFLEVTKGEKLATPKSNLIEYIYGVGATGIVFLGFCFRKIRQSKIRLIIYSFYGLIISSFFAELAFTTVYLFFLLALIQVESAPETESAPVLQPALT